MDLKFCIESIVHEELVRIKMTNNGLSRAENSYGWCNWQLTHVLPKTDCISQIPKGTLTRFSWCWVLGGLFFDLVLWQNITCYCSVASVVSDSVWPHRQQPTRLPPSLGFSRQEHWSGLPFLSPMHESEKWKWSHSVVSDPQRPHGLQPSRLLHPWDFPGKSTGVGCQCLLRWPT